MANAGDGEHEAPAIGQSRLGSPDAGADLGKVAVQLAIVERPQLDVHVVGSHDDAAW